MAMASERVSGLPEHFVEEWKTTRELIDNQDGRIHETRKLVFGLFSTVLAAGNLLGFKADNTVPPRVWFGVHLALLALLIAGRFIEQQALLLQAAAASRAAVLELLTPVELTNTLSDRFPGSWARKTTYIYSTLGIVSAVASAASGIDYWPGIVGISIVYIVAIVVIGRQDIRFARDGEDWSFSTTVCSVGETVSIVFFNQNDHPILPDIPAATLTRLPSGPHDNPFTGMQRHDCELRIPDALLEPGLVFPARRACRWQWTPKTSGTWALKIVDGDDRTWFARRIMYVRDPPPEQPDSGHSVNVESASVELKSVTVAIS